MKNADGGQIVAAENGAGGFAVEELRAGEIAAFDGEIRVDGGDGIDVHLVGAFEEGLLALLRGVEVQRAAYVGDLAVAEGFQVVERFSDAVFVIEEDVADESI